MGARNEEDRRSRRHRSRESDEEHAGERRQRRRHRDDERTRDEDSSRHRERSRHHSLRRRSQSPELRHRESRDSKRRDDGDRRSRRDDARGDRKRRRNSRERRDKRDRRRTRSVSKEFSDEEKEKEEEEARVPVRRGGPLPSQNDSFALVKAGGDPDAVEQPKEKPNFGNTGVLAAASNLVTQADGTTVTLKYHEPPEARKPPPKDVWKLFVFKGADVVDTIDLSARSAWLVGRDVSVVDLPAEHPSLSKQHAVVQFRYTEKKNEYGDRIGRVKPYLIDLESANGTILNGEKVPDSRYLELRDKDMVQFGHSTREYVLMLAR